MTENGKKLADAEARIERVKAAIVESQSRLKHLSQKRSSLFADVQRGIIPASELESLDQQIQQMQALIEEATQALPVLESELVQAHQAIEAEQQRRIAQAKAESKEKLLKIAKRFNDASHQAHKIMLELLEEDTLKQIRIDHRPTFVPDMAQATLTKSVKIVDDTLTLKFEEVK